MKPFKLIRYHSFGVAMLIAVGGAPAMLAQSRAYPDKIRGYKVERTVVEVKSARNNNGANTDSNVDQLITFGKPALSRVTPLGITFDVPIVVAPVTQNGKVDFLVFEDMEINGHSVNISEYNHSFNLPGNAPLTLESPKNSDLPARRNPGHYW